MGRLLCASYLRFYGYSPRQVHRHTDVIRWAMSVENVSVLATNATPHSTRFCRSLTGRVNWFL